MSVIASLLLVVVLGVVPLIILYVLIEGETSDPTIVDRSEAERLAQERGGRPVGEREDSEESTEWGTDGEWGSDSGERGR